MKNLDTLTFIKQFSQNPLEWIAATAENPISKLDNFLIDSTQEQIEDVFKVIESKVFPTSLKNNDLPSLFMFELIKNGLFFDHTKWKNIYNKDNYSFEFNEEYPYQDHNNFKHLFNSSKKQFEQFYKSLGKDAYKEINVMQMNPFCESFKDVNLIGWSWEMAPDAIPELVNALDKFLYQRRDEDFLYPWTYVFSTITNLKDLPKVFDILDKIQEQYPLELEYYDESSKFGTNLDILPWRMALHFMYQIADTNDFDYWSGEKNVALLSNKEFFDEYILEDNIKKAIAEKNYEDGSWENETLLGDDVDSPTKPALCLFKIFAENYFEHHSNIKKDLKIGQYHKEQFWSHPIGTPKIQALITDLFQKDTFVKSMALDWKHERKLPNTLIDYPADILSIMHPLWNVTDGVHRDKVMRSIKNIFDDIAKKNPDLLFKNLKKIKKNIEEVIKYTDKSDYCYFNSTHQVMKDYFDKLTIKTEMHILGKTNRNNQKKKISIL